MTTFTETWADVADGTTINGDLTWTRTLAPDPAVPDISNEALRFTSTEQYFSVRAEHDLGSADHKMACDIVLAIDGGGTLHNLIGPMVRYSASAITGYLGAIDMRNGVISILRIVGGARTTIASRAASISADTTYRVEIEAEGDQLTLRVTGLDDLTVTDGTITSGTRFGIYCRTRDDARPSIIDNVEATDDLAPPAEPPAAPTSLVATGGDGQVNLAWTASAGATGHRVFRHTADVFGSASQIGSDLGAAADSYLDESVTNGTEYFYWVVAFNDDGASDPSISDSATPAAPPPPTFNPGRHYSTDGGTTWVEFQAF